MIIQRLSIDAKGLTEMATRLAIKSEHGFVTPHHFMLSLLGRNSSIARKLLRDAGANIDDLLQANMKALHDAPKPRPGAQETPINRAMEAALARAEQTADECDHKHLGVPHLMLGLLEDEAILASLEAAGAAPATLRGALMAACEREETARQQDQADGEFLGSYCIDLTQRAREGLLDPMIGRQRELLLVIQVLSRRLKNNPVIVGEPGVGKTAIVEGLAQRIADGEVPRHLRHHRLLSLDLGLLVAGTKFRGEFEERIKGILAEVTAAGNILLFVDEIHMLMGAGSAVGGTDASSLLKPALSRGELNCIGATTVVEYRKHIEKDAAFSRRFQLVMVDEPSAEEAITVLRGLRTTYEEHHGVTIGDDAIEAAVKLSRRYITDRFLPDKAIDLLDQAAATLRTTPPTDPQQVDPQQAEPNDEPRPQLIVTARDIAATLATMTGIPAAQLLDSDMARLRRMQDELAARVCGQPQAVAVVTQAVRRSRAHMQDPNRPLASFLMLGPTGVGKTELVKALAEFLFHDRNAMIRIDMSEYMEKHAVARLVGPPPGYVGFEEGGVLTNQVRRRPYSVVLLDEVEKAHADVFNLLLQVLDDGHLTDSQGVRVNFKNTLIILTSNLGAGEVDMRSADYETLSQAMRRAAERHFRPEFLNRLDELVVFRGLTPEVMVPIARLQLARVEQLLADQDCTLTISDEAVRHLAEAGYDPVYGARPLRRVIQRELQDRIADRIIAQALNPGDTIVVDLVDGELTLS